MIKDPSRQSEWELFNQQPLKGYPTEQTLSEALSKPRTPSQNKKEEILKETTEDMRGDLKMQEHTMSDKTPHDMVVREAVDRRDLPQHEVPPQVPAPPALATVGSLLSPPAIKGPRSDQQQQQQQQQEIQKALRVAREQVEELENELVRAPLQSLQSMEQIVKAWEADNCTSEAPAEYKL